jgi:hypothetical protein
MAVTITKKFWNTTDEQYDDIAKIVFTSPNIDSPASAGTRSHILPGSEYIATWYEAVDRMHRIKWNQDAARFLNQEEDFNFAGHTSMEVRSDYTQDFSSGQVVFYDRNNYATITGSTQGPPVATGENLDDVPHTPMSGHTCTGSGSVLYRTGYNDTAIYKYDTTTNQWIDFATAPLDIGVFGSITYDDYDGGGLYIVPGTSNTFLKYDIGNSSWSSLQDLPDVVTKPTALTSVSGVVFYFQCGQTEDKYYKYDISIGSWSDLLTGDSMYTGTPSLWTSSDGYVYTATVYPDIDVAYIKCIYGPYYLNALSYITGLVNWFGGETIYANGAYAAGGHLIIMYIVKDSQTLDMFFRNDFGIGAANYGYLHSWPGGPYLNVDTLVFNEYDDTIFDPTSTVAAAPSIVSLNNDTFYMYSTTDLGANYLYAFHPTVLSGSDQCKSYFSGDGFNESDGSNIVRLGSDYYVSEGKHSTDMWACTISGATGTWSRKAPIPDPSSSSNRYITNSSYDTIVTDGTDIYKFRGLNSTDFYKYTVVSGSWTSLAPTNSVVKQYADMTYVSGTNSIYALQGQYSSALWRYDIGTNTWDTSLDSAPTAFSSKCSILYPDTGGDYLYVVRGNNYEDFWKYSISLDAWYDLEPLSAFSDLSWGLTCSGSNLYTINDINVYKYNISGDTWTQLDGVINYQDSNKRFTSDDTGQYLFVYGNNALRKYDLSDLDSEASVEGPSYSYDLTFSSVGGSSVISTDSELFTWAADITTSGSNLWSHMKNSIVFEVTNGEAYDCRLTAWDDDTHTTTSNKILDEGHYKVVCAALHPYGGTKEEPRSLDSEGVLVHPAGVETVLKGNTSYYGDFDLIHVANGGVSGNEIGEYLIFTPRLDDMDSSFTSGNYDFVTTLHYQYT